MLFTYLRARKRKRLAQNPFPETWEPLLSQHFDHLITPMDADETERFRTHLKVFAWEKHWVGTKGLIVDDEIKVVVSGLAARIARNLSLDVYDRLTEVVVYPSHYKHPDRDGMKIYGEARAWGTVVLSWDAVKHGLVHPTDGHDTAIHEFAHVLDVADGWFDGTPLLHHGDDYKAWAHVLGHYFAKLQKAPTRGVVREYGATNEAEFFAVATEAFFERPKTLRREAPALYKQLERFYRVDPAQ